MTLLRKNMKYIKYSMMRKCIKSLQEWDFLTLWEVMLTSNKAILIVKSLSKDHYQQ